MIGCVAWRISISGGYKMVQGCEYSHPLSSMPSNRTVVRGDTRPANASLINALKTGQVNPENVPPIRVFEKDGQIFTLDNRRLYAFQEAGVEISYRWANAEEVAAESWKFTTANGGTSIRIRGGGSQ